MEPSLTGYLPAACLLVLRVYPPARFAIESWFSRGRPEADIPQRFGMQDLLGLNRLWLKLGEGYRVLCALASGRPLVGSRLVGGERSWDETTVSGAMFSFSLRNSGPPRACLSTSR